MTQAIPTVDIAAQQRSQNLEALKAATGRDDWGYDSAKNVFALPMGSREEAKGMASALRGSSQGEHGIRTFKADGEHLTISAADKGPFTVNSLLNGGRADIPKIRESFANPAAAAQPYINDPDLAGREMMQRSPLLYAGPMAGMPVSQQGDLYSHLCAELVRTHQIPPESAELMVNAYLQNARDASWNAQHGGQSAYQVVGNAIGRAGEAGMRAFNAVVDYFQEKPVPTQHLNPQGVEIKGICNDEIARAMGGFPPGSVISCEHRFDGPPYGGGSPSPGADVGRY